MSPVVAGVRNHLFVQAALTLLFGLLRPGSTGAWTVGTIALAVAAVGLGAALKPTATMRTAVLGFEGLALAFGVVGLTQGHYVPGTIIGVHLLVKLFQTSADDFTAAAPAPVLAPPADGPAAWPPAPATAPWGAPPPAAWAPPAQDSAPWAAPAPAGWPAPAPQVALAPAPFLPPQPGAHPAGRTVVPLVPQQPLAPQVAAPVTQPAAPVPLPATGAAAPSVLEEAVRPLVEAPAPAPEPLPVVAPPTTAPQCMTILPG